MVTRSTVNYKQHKQDVYEIFSKRYGPEKAQRFIDFYADRYDKFNRSFIHYKLAFWLMDDWKYVNRVGTKWYGCVGIGGTGKTTLMKNVLYYLDPSFNAFRVNMSINNFLKTLKSFPIVGAKKACLLDEPDDTFHQSSKEGKKLRDVVGKARQQQLFLGICATTLTDIPPYIYKKLDGIFFLPSLSKAMFFKNKPRYNSYPIQEIREGYSKKGYKIFFELQQQIGCLVFDTQVATPLPKSEEEEYLDMKAKDYEESIASAIEATEIKRKDGLSKSDLIISNLIKKGYTQKQIAELTETTQPRISQIASRISKSLGKFQI